MAVILILVHVQKKIETFLYKQKEKTNPVCVRIFYLSPNAESSLEQ